MKSELYNGWFYDGEGKGGRDSEAAGWLPSYQRLKNAL
jgi:hypothetical protein